MKIFYFDNCFKEEIKPGLFTILSYKDKAIIAKGKLKRPLLISKEKLFVKHEA
jgi:hypothetical protein